MHATGKHFQSTCYHVKVSARAARALFYVPTRSDTIRHEIQAFLHATNSYYQAPGSFPRTVWHSEQFHSEIEKIINVSKTDQKLFLNDFMANCGF